MSDVQPLDIVEQPSAAMFAETLERLVTAIEGAGMTIFGTIDHAANALDVGITMPPTKVLIYGNARGGTPIMLATPLAALDLPLRVLVWETEGGAATIAFHPIIEGLRRAGVPEEAAARLAPAQALLLEAVAP